MNGLTLVYLTNRKEPCFQWFAESLANQWNNRCDLQLIAVDFDSQHEDRTSIYHPHLKRLEGVDFQLTSPKPTVWQGKHRLTTQDYFAASNARNTGIALAKYNYVVFCDDLSVLLPTWFDNVMHGAENNYVVLGSYRKVKELQVVDGFISSYTDHPSGHDSRWGRGSAGGIIPAYPSDLFGCSFGAPLEALLTVNGFDEICDRCGSEDYILGFALSKASYKLFYNRNMTTYESEERHHNCKVFRRIIKPMPDGQIDDSHVLLRRAMNNSGFWTMGNDFNLRQLRESVLSGEPFPVRTSPTNDWADGQPLQQM